MRTHNRSCRRTLFSFCLTLALSSTLASAQHYYLASEIGSPSPAMDDAFGVGLAMGERYIGVGSFRDDVSAGHDGRVYLYDRDTGAYVRTVNRTSASINGSFGFSIDFDGDLMLVGSPVDGQAGIGTPGAGFLFNANTGELITNFYGEIRTPGDRIGHSVALQGPLALLGAPGYDEAAPGAGGVHAYSTELLFQITTLLPDVPIVDEGFGASLAIDGNYIVVGAPHSRNSATQTGSVYVYDVTTGVQLHRIVPPGSSPGDTVGASVDIDNGVIAIGAPSYTRPGLGSSGIVYTYNAASGTLIDTYSPPMPSVLGQFGTSVAIDGDRLVVGSSFAFGGSSSPGRVHVFENGTVERVNVFSIPNGQAFGRHVAAEDGRLAASGTGLSPVEEGFVAVIERFCDADINADGSRDFFDVSAFLKFQFDYNGDGQFDFFDVSAFLADFNSDCI